MPFKSLKRFKNSLSSKYRSKRFVSDSITAYYDRLAEKLSDDARAAGWQSSRTQNLRFLSLSLIADLSESTILDVGCGVGDLYVFLKTEFHGFQYHGIDLSQKMIERAQEKHPEASFSADNLFAFSEKKASSYDYVLASGAFSYKVPKPMHYLRECIVEMQKLSKKGIAFNLLSEQAPSELKVQSRFHYYNPVEVLALCLEFTPYVELKHHYLQNDFTVFLHFSLDS